MINSIQTLWMKISVTKISAMFCPVDGQKIGNCCFVSVCGESKKAKEDGVKIDDSEGGPECTSVLISDQYVLSAAHCFSEFETQTRYLHHHIHRY